MRVRVPARLRSAAALIPGDVATVADVGAGHGALAAHLALSRDLRVIAIERSPGPLAELHRNLAAWRCEDRIDIRAGSGLTPLLEGEAEMAVIAGVGATTALEIAAQAPGRGVRWLVLQCMQRDQLVLPWLADRGWAVRATDVCVQRGRAYTARLVEVPG